jgi:methanethiol S-methyltransferase
LLFSFWQWPPSAVVVWSFENQEGYFAIYTLYFFGWLLLLLSTFMIDHFELFGLRQVWRYMRGQEYASIDFSSDGQYQHVRHPIYLSWLIISWATPRMTAGRLLFAAAATVYIFAAVQLEERDLIRSNGGGRRRYRELATEEQMNV